MSETTTKVVHLRAVEPSATPPSTGLLGDFERWLSDTGILDMGGDLQGDVTLEDVHPDETAVGTLLPIERQWFVLTTLLKQAYEEEEQEWRIANVERAAKYMREFNVDIGEAMSKVHGAEAGEYAAEPDQIHTMHLLTLAMATAHQMYQWQVRSRLGYISDLTIIRKGWTVCTYG